MLNSPWTPVRDAYLVKRLAEGAKYAVIADEINRQLPSDTPVSRVSCIGRANRLGTGSVSKEPTWTEERIEKFRELHADGWSYARIAVALSELPGPKVSKRSVLSARPRIGLSVRARVMPVNPSPPARPRVDREHLKHIDIGSRHVEFLDLKRQECRFAFGEGPFTFCGLPQQNGSAYCSHHHQLCYTTPANRVVAKFKRVGGSRPSFRYDGAAA